MGQFNYLDSTIINDNCVGEIAWARKKGCIDKLFDKQLINFDKKSNLIKLSAKHDNMALSYWFKMELIGGEKIKTIGYSYQLKRDTLNSVKWWSVHVQIVGLGLVLQQNAVN